MRILSNSFGKHSMTRRHRDIARMIEASSIVICLVASVVQAERAGVHHATGWTAEPPGLLHAKVSIDVVVRRKGVRQPACNKPSGDDQGGNEP